MSIATDLLKADHVGISDLKENLSKILKKKNRKAHFTRVVIYEILGLIKQEHTENKVLQIVVDIELIK